VVVVVVGVGVGVGVVVGVAVGVAVVVAVAVVVGVGVGVGVGVVMLKLTQHEASRARIYGVRVVRLGTRWMAFLRGRRWLSELGDDPAAAVRAVLREGRVS